MKLKNKYALVTGASTGIGRAIAIELAKEGAYVEMFARREEKLKEVQQLIENSGGKASYTICDLENMDAAEEFWQGAKWFTDDVDIIVNTAAIWHDEQKVFADITYDDFSPKTVLQTMKVGIVAPMLLTHLLIPNMPKGSSILNITGTFENGGKGWLPYYTAKRALEDFTVGLAEDMKEKGIKVNAISPSDTNTEEYQKYFPKDAKDAMEPEEIARFAIKLITSEGSGEIWVLKKDQEPQRKFHA